MDDKESRDLVPLGAESSSESHHYSDPVKQLQKCRDRFQENEKGYHMTRIELVAQIYLLALLLIHDKEAQDRFFALNYFQKAWKRHVRTERDLLREVFKFVTGEGNKIASKYAKILWLLYEARIRPEDAASAIFCAGGIEKMARHGLWKPEYLDPRDVGDGMDGYGRKIDYPDEQPKPRNEDDEPSKTTTNADLLYDYVDSAPQPEGSIVITARYAQVRGRSVVQFLDINAAASEPDDGPPPPALLPVEMTRDMRDQMAELGEGKALWIRVERRLTAAGTDKFVGTKLAKPKPAQQGGSHPRLPGGPVPAGVAVKAPQRKFVSRVGKMQVRTQPRPQAGQQGRWKVIKDVPPSPSRPATQRDKSVDVAQGAKSKSGGAKRGR